jgi:hypothetical protein
MTHLRWIRASSTDRGRSRVRVVPPEALATVLPGNEIPFRDEGPAIHVDATDTCGSTVTFA